MDGSDWNEPEVNGYQGEHSLSMVMLVDPKADVAEESIGESPSSVTLDQSMDDPIASDMNDTRTESADEQTQYNDSTTSALNTSQAVEHNTVNATQTSHRSLLRRIHAAQVNPPKEPHMRALKFEPFWPRNLRRVASAPRQKDTLEIVEAPPPQKKCLTPKRKGILMGVIFGALVVGIALGIVVTLLIERSSVSTTTTTTTSTTSATTTTSTSATTSTTTSTSSTSSTSTTSTTSTTTSTTTTSTTTTSTSTTTTTTTSATTTTSTSATTVTTTTTTSTTSTSQTTTTATTTTATTTTTVTTDTAASTISSDITSMMITSSPFIPFDLETTSLNTNWSLTTSEILPVITVSATTEGRGDVVESTGVENQKSTSATILNDSTPPITVEIGQPSSPPNVETLVDSTSFMVETTTSAVESTYSEVETTMIASTSI